MSLSARSIVMALTICVGFAPRAVGAQSEHAPADKTLSPYFFVDGGDPAIDRLPLKDTRVDVAITGVVADVTVRQVYQITDRGRFMPAMSFQPRRGRPSTH